jgi:hypothetical protein
MLNWPTAHLDVDRLRSTGAVFSEEVEKDDWILYHGTSGRHAESIESNGVGIDGDSSLRDDIARIVSVFERMNWCGVNTGGYAVLASFSKHDLREETRHPAFLAETSNRALLYASRDFAGGEKLRGIRRALDDLANYLADAEVRAEHMRSQKRVFDEYSGWPHLPPEIEALRPREPDLEMLERELASFSVVRAHASDAISSFQFGVVYALRIKREDLPRLRSTQSMGVEAMEPISPRRIVAKVIVPPEYVHDPFGVCDGNWCEPSGVLSAIRPSRLGEG